MGDFFDSYEVVLDTLVSEDVCHVLAIPELDRGLIEELDDVVLAVVLIRGPGDLTLEWVQEVLFDLWEGSTQNKAIDTSRRETLACSFSTEPVRFTSTLSTTVEPEWFECVRCFELLRLEFINLLTDDVHSFDRGAHEVVRLFAF